MAEAEKTGLDKMVESEEAEIQKFTEGMKPGDSTNAVSGETKPAEEETKPVETEAKPAAEETKHAETETKPEAEKVRPTWKQLKEIERMSKAQIAEIERLKQENERLKAAVTIDDELPDDTDELEKYKGDLEETKRQVALTQEQIRLQTVKNEIDLQERDFQKDHPDYRAALDYLVESARTEWTHDGSINRMARTILQKDRANLETWAVDQGFIDDEGNVKYQEAAKECAFRIMVNTRRSEMVNNWREEGLNVAEQAYKFAGARGFTAQRQPAPGTKTEENPSRDRVLRAKETQAASASLSDMQTGGTKQPGEITRRQQILDMSHDEQAAYIAKMDKEDEDWFSKLGE